MAENHIAHESAFAPEAATDEPASPLHQSEADDGAWPDFASEEEAAAYCRGVAHGIRCAGREPGHPHMPKDFSLNLARDPASPSLVSAKLIEAWPEEQQFLPGTGRGTAPSAVEGAACQAQIPLHQPTAGPPPRSGEDKGRTPRHDGWLPDRQCRFLDELARTGVVADACRVAGMSRDSAYALRKRAEGRAFALGWDAAVLISRRAVADDVMSRSRHGVIDRVYRNGELVAERHRYDNRLTMAVLTRLDRLAEGQGEGAAVANIVAGEWSQFLDIVAAGGDGAESFLRARAPSLSPSREREAPRSGAGRGEAANPAAAGLQSAATLLARLASYEKYQAGLAQEIRTSDLDPARMREWAEDQWARAERSGLLDRLPADAWPPEALSEEQDGTDGMCRVRQLYLERHPAALAPAPGEPEDEFEGCEVWEEEEDEWRTNFPPPPGFDGFEESEPGDGDYQRELTGEELAALGLDPDTLSAERAAELDERVAAESIARDRYFGFTPDAWGKSA